MGAATGAFGGLVAGDEFGGASKSLNDQISDTLLDTNFNVEFYTLGLLNGSLGNGANSRANRK